MTWGIIQAKLTKASPKTRSPGCFTQFIRQHFAVPLPHGDKKLIDGHGRVDGDFTPEQCLDVMLLFFVRERETNQLFEGKERLKRDPITLIQFGQCSDKSAVRPLMPIGMASPRHGVTGVTA